MHCEKTIRRAPLCLMKFAIGGQRQSGQCSESLHL